MFFLLEWIGVPLWLRNFIQLFYFKIIHILCFKGKAYQGVPIFSGIKQGCPMSGTLFAYVADVLNRALAWCNLPLSLAFADDIISILRLDAKMIFNVEMIFKIFASFSGLVLNKLKCIIIPLRAQDMEAIKKFLAIHMPSWLDFKFDLKAAYLGFMVGPGAGDETWRKQFSKFSKRMQIIKKLGLDIPNANFLANMHAFPVFSFVAQLEHPPLWISKKVNEICRQFDNWPNGALGKNVLMLWAFGIPKSLSNFDVYCKASMMRSSTQTVTVTDNLQSILSEALETIPVCQWGKSKSLGDMHFKKLSFLDNMISSDANMPTIAKPRAPISNFSSEATNLKKMAEDICKELQDDRAANSNQIIDETHSDIKNLR
jgi:hypothetical protein